MLRRLKRPTKLKPSNKSYQTKSGYTKSKENQSKPNHTLFFGLVCYQSITDYFEKYEKMF